MKKLFGFTLAEVLVTMGIVGVVAALTTPVLVTNVRRQGYATTLRATVTDIENAFSSAIINEQADDLYGTRLWQHAPITTASSSADRQQFIADLREVMKINGADANNNSVTYYTSRGLATHVLAANGGVGAVSNLDNNYIPISLKNGAIMFIRTFNAANGGEINAADIWIDVNGPAAPNTIGRDLHPWYLSSNASMLPCGGQELADAGEMNSWRNTCTNGNFGNNGNWGGVTCTGRLVENNYVFDY